MGLFTRKPKGQTVVLLDVESGSVASALVRLEKGVQPRIISQTRVRLVPPATHDVSSLLQKIEKAAHDALVHAAEVAARLRNSTSMPKLGEVVRTTVVLHPPWALLEVSDGPQSRTSEHVLQTFRAALNDRFGHVPANFHPFGAVAAHGAHLKLEGEGALLCSIMGEICELLAVENGVIVGAATIPFGHHHVLRTLRSHGGLSWHEARSAMELGYAHEPLKASADEFALQFTLAARELLQNNTKRLYIVGDAPAANWAGRALSGHAHVSALFPEGGTVQALRPAHFAAHADTSAQTDISLLLGSLFINSKMLQ